MPRKSRGTRSAEVILPEGFEIPELVIPDVQDYLTLPEPHHFGRLGVRSYRGHARAHHRIDFTDPGLKWVKKRVAIPVPEQPLEIEPVRVSWRRYSDHVRMTFHHMPEEKNLRDMNRKQRDWKARDRDSTDTYGPGLLSYRSAHLPELYGALRYGPTPRIVNDTALVLWNRYR